MISPPARTAGARPHRAGRCTVRCRLRLTPDEALSGARRRIRLPGREEPLRLKLPQGLQDGDVLELDGIRLQSGGAELTVKLLNDR